MLYHISGCGFYHCISLGVPFGNDNVEGVSLVFYPSSFLFINAAYESDSSQSGQDCECTGTFCTCSRKTINVITDKPKELLFDIIEHIADEELRNKYLQELKRLVLSHDEGTSKPKPIVQPFSMQRVMAKFNSPSEPSVADLKGEISVLKGEIKNLKKHLAIQSKFHPRTSSGEEIFY